MKTNEIRITIKSPRPKVFEFTLEPNNKKLWSPNFASEYVSPEQINLGTFYINSDDRFEVTDYEKNIFIELTHTENSYQCSYSFHKIDDDTTEIVYFETMQDGSELSDPLDVKYFETLKTLLES